MNRKKFINLLNEKNYSFNKLGKRIIVDHKGDLNLEGVKNLPEKIVFLNDGHVNLSFLNYVPNDTIFKNKGSVNLYRCSYVEDSVLFANRGDVNLSKCRKITDLTTFINIGNVNINNCETIPASSTFVNRGDVSAAYCQSLDSGVSFNNSGNVLLSSCQNFPNKSFFNNGGKLIADSLKSINKGYSFSNGGDIIFPNVKDISSNISFKNNGNVILNRCERICSTSLFQNKGNVSLENLKEVPFGLYYFKNSGLVSLSDGEYKYGGDKISIRNIDGVSMIIDNSKTRDGFSIYSARYFGGGSLNDLSKCYIAEGVNHNNSTVTAHGETLRQAIDELTFKIERAALWSMNKEERAKAIKNACVDVVKTNQVTFKQWNLITGACKAGTAAFLGMNSSELPDYMDIIEVIEKSYMNRFGVKFRNNLSENGYVYDGPLSNLN